MGGSGETGTGAPAVDWGATGRALRQRAWATMALGEALEGLAAGRGVCPQALADQLQQIIGAALGQGVSRGDGTQRVPSAPAKRTSATRMTPADPGVALRAVQSMDLAGRSWPLV